MLFTTSAGGAPAPVSRVLVTGGRGFVGRHLCRELGDDAVVADADVLDPDAVMSALRSARPRAVVHLAAHSSVGSSWSTASEVWTVNAVGTVNVLEAVREESPEARVVFASTGDVYGNAATIPTPETEAVAPVSPYAASKAAAEVACDRARRADGLDVVVARLFQAVGPGQEERFAVGSWTRQIARLEQVGGGTPRVGDLKVRRDLTDVRDVCRALRLLLGRDVAPATYNVASGTAVPLEDVVGSLIRLARCSVDVAVDPALLRRVDIPLVCGDPAQLLTATGWAPRISLEDTLRDALDHARRRVAAEVPAGA